MKQVTILSIPSTIRPSFIVEDSQAIIFIREQDAGILRFV